MISFALLARGASIRATMCPGTMIMPGARVCSLPLAGVSTAAEEVSTGRVSITFSSRMFEPFGVGVSCGLNSKKKKRIK